VSYRATADWNLIADFDHPVSFRHRADGFGVEGELGVGYRIGRRMEILAVLNGFGWETGTGIDELYHSSSPSQQTQLNEVALTGAGVRLGAKWEW
jgi:hypothetical protein